MSGLNSNTVLLAHMDGTDGGTTFSDSSDSAHANASVGGNAITTAGVLKWGTASCFLDGTGDYLAWDNSADFDFVGSATQDYTIDFWVKFTDHTGTENILYQYGSETDGVYTFTFSHTDGTGFNFYIKTQNVQRILVSGVGEVADTDWHHIALCKVTSAGPTVEWGIYKDGTQINYASNAITGSTTSMFYNGADNGGASALSGAIDELRVNKSNAFNAAPNSGTSSTITVPTSAYSREEGAMFMGANF